MNYFKYLRRMANLRKHQRYTNWVITKNMDERGETQEFREGVN